MFVSDRLYRGLPDKNIIVKYLNIKQKSDSSYFKVPIYYLHLLDIKLNDLQ